MSKLRVGVLFGGRSTEHEVSVLSATNVFKALDPGRYAPVLIGVDHDGRWYAAESDAGLLPEAVFSRGAALEVSPSLHAGLELIAAGPRAGGLRAPLDVIFPLIHGRGGEDGSLQGLLDLSGVPYVGCGVLASAVAMDKVATKRMLRSEGVPVVPCVEFVRRDALNDPQAFADAVEHAFEYPVFVKPVNTGSSVGIDKAHSREELIRALKDAARYDLRVMVEPGLQVRELEVAVLGGWDPEASVLGEVVPAGEWYDYEAKYVSEDTELIVPAQVPAEIAERVRELAIRAFRALDCWGMARADFFLDRRTDELLLNELNTIPGLTDGSLYWRLWEASGLSLPALLDRLIELALERQRERASLELRYRKL
jgi:D-alanine-D-alanine ligase